MNGDNDLISSELEKEGIPSASCGEDAFGEISEEHPGEARSVEELVAALENAEREKAELTDALPGLAQISSTTGSGWIETARGTVR